ncbi:hypothetical protein ADUPG1_012992 [Aduncisulcus paluster]|uniref:VHS domain-containing protein n=1 Tax=Aduncisulcus paluster TaxID=2918883 RepID=A0ABQ5K4L3_9EUKA|nr:hypothetical protein ADUPG1_012992 [Aduncisulcus paluster]
MPKSHFLSKVVIPGSKKALWLRRLDTTLSSDSDEYAVSALNWSRVLGLVDMVNSNPANAHDLMMAVRYRLSQSDESRTLIDTLNIVDALAKNCSHIPQHLASPKFLAILTHLIESPKKATHVRKRAMYLLSLWAITLGGMNPPISHIATQLRALGYHLPNPDESEISVLSETMSTSLSQVSIPMSVASEVQTVPHHGHHHHTAVPQSIPGTFPSSQQDDAIGILSSTSDVLLAVMKRSRSIGLSAEATHSDETAMSIASALSTSLQALKQKMESTSGGIPTPELAQAVEVFEKANKILEVWKNLGESKGWPSTSLSHACGVEEDGDDVVTATSGAMSSAVYVPLSLGQDVVMGKGKDTAEGDGTEKQEEGVKEGSDGKTTTSDGHPKKKEERIAHQLELLLGLQPTGTLSPVSDICDIQGTGAVKHIIGEDGDCKKEKSCVACGEDHPISSSSITSQGPVLDALPQQPSKAEFMNSFMTNSVFGTAGSVIQKELLKQLSEKSEQQDKKKEEKYQDKAKDGEDKDENEQEDGDSSKKKDDPLKIFDFFTGDTVSHPQRPEGSSDIGLSSIDIVEGQSKGDDDRKDKEETESKEKEKEAEEDDFPKSKPDSFGVDAMVKGATKRKLTPQESFQNLLQKQLDALSQQALKIKDPKDGKEESPFDSLIFDKI